VFALIVHLLLPAQTRRSANEPVRVQNTGRPANTWASAAGHAPACGLDVAFSRFVRTGFFNFALWRTCAVRSAPLLLAIRRHLRKVVGLTRLMPCDQ
jgi:hypothetical protein